MFSRVPACLPILDCRLARRNAGRALMLVGLNPDASRSKWLNSLAAGNCAADRGASALAEDRSNRQAEPPAPRRPEAHWAAAWAPPSREAPGATLLGGTLFGGKMPGGIAPGAVLPGTVGGGTPLRDTSLWNRRRRKRVLGIRSLRHRSLRHDGSGRNIWISAAAQFIGPAHQLFRRHDQLRLQLEVDHPMITQLGGHQVLADEVDAWQIPPRCRHRLQNRQRFIAILDQPNLSRAVIGKIVRDRRRADFVVIDKQPRPGRISAHR